MKIFSPPLGCRFVLLTVSFVLQKLFSFMWFHLLIVELRACAVGVLIRKLFHVPVSFRVFLSLIDWVFLVLCWSLWSTWTWILFRVINMDLFVFFYSQLDHHHFLKMLYFFHCMVLSPLSSVLRCVDLFLGCLFDSIDLPICFCGWAKSINLFTEEFTLLILCN